VRKYLDLNKIFSNLIKILILEKYFREGLTKILSKSDVGIFDFGCFLYPSRISFNVYSKRELCPFIALWFPYLIIPSIKELVHIALFVPIPHFIPLGYVLILNYVLTSFFLSISNNTGFFQGEFIIPFYLIFYIFF